MLRFLISLLLATSWTASASPALQGLRLQTLEENVPPPEESPGWQDPSKNGGRMLDFATRRFGEPLNVIVSGASDPAVLSHSGFQLYAKSLGLAPECLGFHIGSMHYADLGDGDGKRMEQFLARQHYIPMWGTCIESLLGGNHFRAWKQNGTEANTGAWFLAVSKEKWSGQHHKIVPDGYNVGRDWLVARAVAGSWFKGFAWKAEVEWRDDLLPPGKEGINHAIEQDGRTAVLTVYRAC